MEYTEHAQTLLHRFSLQVDPDRLAEIMANAESLARTRGRALVLKEDVAAGAAAASPEFVEALT